MDSEDDSLQMHLLHEHNSPPAKIQILYRLLLECMRTRNICSFKSLIEQGLRKRTSMSVNYVYPNRSDETLLDIACKSGMPEFVEFLLEKGAKVNRINETHNRAPIHFATENGHVDVLKILLQEPTINPNLEAGQQTALHIAVKKQNLNCAELLLMKDASPNIPNSKGLTALHIAAMTGQKDMVDLIFKKSTHTVDLDNYKDYNEQTTRTILQKKFPELPLPPTRKSSANIHDLKYYLKANDQTNFLKCLKSVEENVIKDEAEYLLEMAVKRHFYKAVVMLLDRIKGAGYNLEQAAIIAIQQGQPDILREILGASQNISSDLILNASMELGIPREQESDNTSDRLECFKLILERDDVDVRCSDCKGNTPLHYAARANCYEAVTLLLEKGSYIGHMNHFDVPPIADISAMTLSRYFDDCLQTKKEYSNEYAIEFDYRCLMSHDTTKRMKGRGKNSLQYNEYREIDIFRYIANNDSLKHLLKHPLLSSFLYLKWHRIRHILYLNFAFYLLFYISLNAYIWHKIDESAQNTSTLRNNVTESSEFVESASVGEHILKILTGIAWLILTIREIMQFVSSPCRYIRSFENWLEVTLLILGFLVLNGAGVQVATIAILLSAWEIVTLIGQHPRMSTNIEMFKTVSRNCMSFLILYVFLILAFALAFFTLFKDNGNENFPSPGHSLFKTIIMLTGELDANDIPFVSHPILSHLVFVSFVFFIVIVLFNLLNALAVSNTADILGKAELVGLISRVRLIAYLEDLAVNTPFDHRNRCLPCYVIPHSRRWRPFAFLIRRILIFPNFLKSGKLLGKMYDGLGDYTDQKFKEKHLTEDDRTNKMFPTFQMDAFIIKQAKDILSKRGRESDSEKILRELKKMNDRLTVMDLTLNSVKRSLENNNVNVNAHDTTDN